GKPVLEYVKTEKPVPEGIDAHFRRSGYIHPVFSPTGEEVTGDFPEDHPHQHALFFAWTKSTFDGRKVDFWNQAKQLAGVEFREVVEVQEEENQVSFSVKHAFTVGQGNERVDALHENWTVTVYQTPHDHFLFDLTSVQECASEKPLILPEYHYGGMAFRGNANWLKEKDDHSVLPGDLQFLTSEGRDRWDGNHTQPNWVTLSGSIRDQEISATVFCSPENFRAPQPVRIHPSKPYFCFAPMVTGPFEITPGKKYISQYRYLITSEAADLEQIEKQWTDYVSP
ncbi:MAG: DUF6807 family protein, partial [Verrucomicrobiota bacterium]